MKRRDEIEKEERREGEKKRGKRSESVVCESGVEERKRREGKGRRRGNKGMTQKGNGKLISIVGGSPSTKMDF